IPTLKEISFLFQLLGSGGKKLVHDLSCGAFDHALPYGCDHPTDLRFASVAQFGLTALLGKFDGACIFSGDGGDAELYGGLEAVWAIRIEAFAAGEQFRQAIWVRQKRPDLRRRGWENILSRKFHALPWARANARSRARRAWTQAISRR